MLACVGCALLPGLSACVDDTSSMETDFFRTIDTDSASDEEVGIEDEEESGSGRVFLQRRHGRRWGGLR